MHFFKKKKKEGIIIEKFKLSKFMEWVQMNVERKKEKTKKKTSKYKKKKKHFTGTFIVVSFHH